MSGISRKEAFLMINQNLSSEICEELDSVLNACEKKVSHIARYPLFKASHEFRSVATIPPFSLRRLSPEKQITIFKGKTFGRLNEGGQRKIDHAMNLVTRERFAHARMVLEQNYSSQDYNREVLIMGTLLKDNPYCVKLVDHYIYQGRKNFKTKVGMITPYYEKKDLFCRKYLPYTDRDILRWSKQILICLNEAHQQGITHNDLKCDNVFVNKDDDIAIGDWGLARISSENLNEKDERNEYLIPPEWIDKTKSHLSCRFRPEGDMWAFGILLYELIYKSHPDFILELVDEDSKLGYIGRFKDKLKAYQSKNCTNPLELLAQKALNCDPANRPTAAEMIKLIDAELAKLS